MVVNNQIQQKILEQLLEGEYFREVTLTPAGDLFITPDRTVKADQFWVYYKPAVYLGGSLYVNCDGAFNCYGDTLHREECFKLRKNKTEIRLLPSGNIQLFSKNAGIPVGSTLVAFFQYDSEIVVIGAGDRFNRRSQIFIMESTDELYSRSFKEFAEALELCDSRMAKHLSIHGETVTEIPVEN